ncbi:MAG: TMEM165/GDT1 family protein [Chloroflexi bacterium]|nr:TMEM165/GDT1 family protein [Chloroflexota bacterium]
MNAFFSTLVLVMLAELGDKTRLIALILSVRYAAPWVIFAGMTLGYGVVTALAVIFGDLLSRVLPFSIVKYPLGAAFILFGVLLLAGKWGEEEEEEGEGKKEGLLKRVERLGPFWVSFLLIALTEMGDKTQLTTAAMAVRYGGSWMVFLGSLTALAILNAIFCFLGAKISGRIPIRLVKRASALLFVAFGVFVLLSSL